MPALLVTILTGFGTFLTTSLLARVASLVVFSTIGMVTINTMLDSAMSHIDGLGTVGFFVRLIGVGEGFSMIGAALLLKATISAWSMRPGAAITGG